MTQQKQTLGQAIDQIIGALEPLDRRKRLDGISQIEILSVNTSRHIGSFSVLPEQTFRGTKRVPSRGIISHPVADDVAGAPAMSRCAQHGFACSAALRAADDGPGRTQRWFVRAAIIAQPRSRELARAHQAWAARRDQSP